MAVQFHASLTQPIKYKKCYMNFCNILSGANDILEVRFEGFKAFLSAVKDLVC